MVGNNLTNSATGKASANGDMIVVEVAYALPELQKIVSLSVPAGTTAYDAAVLSGIDGCFEGLDLQLAPMGIFGHGVDAKSRVLTAGERVEIYRPLLIDPKESRKARAAKVKAAQSDTVRKADALRRTSDQNDSS